MQKRDVPLRTWWVWDRLTNRSKRTMLKISRHSFLPSKHRRPQMNSAIQILKKQTKMSQPITNFSVKSHCLNIPEKWLTTKLKTPIKWTSMSTHLKMMKTQSGEVSCCRICWLFMSLRASWNSLPIELLTQRWRSQWGSGLRWAALNFGRSQQIDGC